MTRLAAGILLALGYVGQLLAHGLVHERIDAMSAQIELEPARAELYWKRAELYRIDRDFPAAAADLDRAAALDPALTEVDLTRGRVWADADEPVPAREAFDRFIAARPTHAAARFERAGVLARIGAYRAAVEDYDVAIGQIGRAKPEHYVARARAQAAQGAASIGMAIDGLDEAMRQLGPLISLADVGIELEVQHGEWGRAITRIDRVIASGARKDVWLVRRAEVLTNAGRIAEARADYAAALDAMRVLPEHVRRHRANVELEQLLRAKLD